MGTGGLNITEGTAGASTAGQHTPAAPCILVCIGDDDSGAAHYNVFVANVTDDSQRLRIIHTAEAGTMTTATSTWINVTTGHTVSSVIQLPGTTVLSYDISAPADLVGSTDINVYITTDGNNSTDNALGSIDVQTSGNVKSGVVDLVGSEACSLTMTTFGCVQNEDISPTTLGGTSAQTSLIGIAFQMTHAAGSDMAADADYAIYADFCNFDQDNGSLAHSGTCR